MNEARSPPDLSLITFISSIFPAQSITFLPLSSDWISAAAFKASLQVRKQLTPLHQSMLVTSNQFKLNFLILWFSVKERKALSVLVAALVVTCIGIALAAAYSMLKPISNGCNMTYMYPTYIPISSGANLSTAKYGLYLYHEGWRKIDFNEHLKKLSGIPMLFIPGNGGSYKQVRSLAAESDRAYQGGPLERMFYQEASLTVEEGVNMDFADLPIPNQYTCMLDWFAVDLEGEHSAMDGRILEEHTEYVVYAINRILDLYKESHETRVREGAAGSGNLPKSVILVGHSMGGFVARAAIVHPHLRKSTVETVLTLSAPHQSPPVALQPSLGHYYAHVNKEWRKGYEVHTSRTGRYMSSPLLSNVVVVSISGGINDYQYDVVHSLTVNMCHYPTNLLRSVVFSAAYSLSLSRAPRSHRLFQYYPSRLELGVFVNVLVRAKLESLDGIVPPTHGFMISSSSMKNVWLSMEHQVILWCNQLVVQVSHTLLSLTDPETGRPYSEGRKRLAIFAKMLRSGMPENWLKLSHLSRQLPQVPSRIRNMNAGSQVNTISACPSSVHWSDDGLERDLYIETATVTVLAMDGRRRWLDIKKLVRLHLWPEKGLSDSDMSASKKVLEVTLKMVQIPSGPAPRQIEPGSQTEQASPSAVFWLDSEDMRGYRFLTISVAPSPILEESCKKKSDAQAISGRPPPAASMAVGQFFNPDEGKRQLSPHSLLLSMYSQMDMTLKEDHPLALNMLFTISLGLLPVKLSLKTTGCGIKESGFADEEVGDMENSRLCKLRCFPPVALAWDSTSGLHVFPNLYSETIEVDSSPALWSSTQGSEKTTVLLLVDPHCSYTTSVAVSFTAAARRFLLLYCSQIVGFSFAVIFFALMRQANAWELDLPIPSVLSAVVYNLRMPLTFLVMAIVPIMTALLYSFLSSQPIPPVISFFVISVIRIIRVNPLVVTSVVAIALVCLVHPALGLFILLLSHALCCHNALSSHALSEDLFDFGSGSDSSSEQLRFNSSGRISKGGILVNEHHSSSSQSPDFAQSYGETQLEIFHHRHGLLILHLLAALMFGPSFVAWLQRIGMGHSFPWFWDSILCIGVILHGICDSKPEFNFFLFPISSIRGWEARLSFAYLVAGYCSYLSGLALAPYRAFYAMAAIGFISFVFRILERRNRERGEAYHSSRKHSHRH
ncbi:hypothetical protein LguiA_031814 [Lonicera macranthoides]